MSLCADDLNAMSPLLNLPVEILLMIFKQLDVKSMLRFTSVCAMLYYSFPISYDQQFYARCSLSTNAEPRCGRCFARGNDECRCTEGFLCCRVTPVCEKPDGDDDDDDDDDECGMCNGCMAKMNRWLPNGEPFILITSGFDRLTCDEYPGYTYIEERRPGGFISRKFSNAFPSADRDDLHQLVTDDRGKEVYSQTIGRGMDDEKWTVGSDGVFCTDEINTCVPAIEFDDALWGAAHTVRCVTVGNTQDVVVYDKNGGRLACAWSCGPRVSASYHYVPRAYFVRNPFTGEIVDTINVEDYPDSKRRAAYRTIKFTTYGIPKTCKSSGMCKASTCWCYWSTMYVLLDGDTGWEEDSSPHLVIYKVNGKRTAVTDANGNTHAVKPPRQAEIEDDYCIGDLFA